MNLPVRPITPTPADVAIVTAHRRAMYEAMGHDDDALLTEMATHFVPWVQRHLEKSTYLGWFVLDGEQIVAGAGIWVQDWPPHVLDPKGRRAYILNIYVEPSHRRQGIARHLTQLCVDWSREQGIKVVTLHYSDAGKTVYEGLGFTTSNEMRITLP